MTDKELDKLFQQSFSAHELPVPEDMWQRVNTHKEKKRRIVLWWWSGMGVAALLIAGTFAWRHAMLSPANASAVNIIASAKNKSSRSAAATGGGANKKPSSNAVITHKNQDALPVAPADDYAGFQQDQSLIISNNKTRNQAGNRSISKDHSQGNTNEIALVKSDKESEELLSLQDKTANKFDSNKSKPEYGLLVSLPGLKPADSAVSMQNEKALKVDSAATGTKAYAVKVHLPARPKTAVEWMVAGYAGDRAVYHVQKPAPDFLVSLHNPQVKTLVHSFSLNVRVEKPVGHHWSVKTGLQFLQTHQSITYTAESVNRYAVVNALSFSLDTTRFTEINVERPQVKSICNSFNIPLFVSYHSNGKKIDFGVSGGMLVNVFSWYKGVVTDGNYSKKIDASQAFRQNSGSSLYLSIPVIKSFGNWQLFAEPQLQYSLSSLTKESASFRQRITYYGVGIGIRKSIGK